MADLKHVIVPQIGAVCWWKGKIRVVMPGDGVWPFADFYRAHAIFPACFGHLAIQGTMEPGSFIAPRSRPSDAAFSIWEKQMGGWLVGPLRPDCRLYRPRGASPAGGPLGFRHPMQPNYANFNIPDLGLAWGVVGAVSKHPFTLNTNLALAKGLWKSEKAKNSPRAGTVRPTARPSR